MVSMVRMDTNMTDVLGGIVWSRWRGGSWLGVKTDDNVGVRNRLTWIRTGDGAGQNVQGWKHACLSIDWETGDIFMVENGQVMLNERVKGVVMARQTMDTRVDTFTVGCFHGYDFLSTRGPVTDFHVYSRNLYMEEIVNFTTCSTVYPAGNIINWDTADWVLQTKANMSEPVRTYFEEDVCAQTNYSTVLIPISNSKPDPCQKLSGHTIGYHTKEQLYALSTQLAKRSHVADRGMCMFKVHTWAE